MAALANSGNAAAERSRAVSNSPCRRAAAGRPNTAPSQITKFRSIGIALCLCTESHPNPTQVKEVLSEQGKKTPAVYPSLIFRCQGQRLIDPLILYSGRLDDH